MDGSKSPLISIIIVTYNSDRYVKKCLESIFAANYKNFEVIVVDNGSTDATLSIIKTFKKVHLKISRKNLGYAGGNNLGLMSAKGRFIAILNPDTKVDRCWLEPMVELLESGYASVCQPKILLMEGKKLINCTGKQTHFLGFDWLKDYKRKDYNFSANEITSFSGSAFLIKKDIFLKFGGFNENFFMYYEDGDLSWKVRLLGEKILVVPKSVAYHDYKYLTKDKNKNKNKFYFLERNRLLMILTNYSLKTLLLILPALFLLELCMNLYFLIKGFGFGKLKGYLWIIAHSDSILKQRSSVQKKRKVNDSQIVKDFVGTIEFEEFNNVILKFIINPFLSFYWYSIKLFI